MKKNKATSNQLSLPFFILKWVLIMVFFSLMIVPLINTLALSFSTKAGSMASGIRLWPDHFTVEGYISVWNRGNLSKAFFNSVFVTGVATFVQMILASLAGYVLIQKGLPFKKTLVTFIMITMMIPSDLTLIPLYIMNSRLELLNTYTGLIINNLISGMSILLMRNYFLSVPISIVESARIEGLNEFKIFLYIYLPLSLPGLASVSFIEFVGRWNSLIVPATLTTDSDYFTLPLLLKNMIFSSEAVSGTDFLGINATSAGIVISILPLVITYFFIQRFLMTGLTLGANKE